MRPFSIIATVSVLLFSATVAAGGPNPDVPFGGVVVDVNFGYSNNVPKSSFRNSNSYGGQDNSGYEVYKLKGLSGKNLTATLLFPLSSRWTGRLGYRLSDDKFKDNHFIKSTDPNVAEVFLEREFNHSVSTYSIGFRVHIGGSNKWSNQ